MTTLVGRILIAVVAGLALAPLQAPAQGVQTLRLLASPVDDVMPVLYAQRAGMFERVGLNISLDRVNTGAASAAAVVGGAADLGKGDITSIIAAHVHNVPLVIVAPAAIYDPKTPDSVLLALADSSIRTARDLMGKTVGVPTVGSIATSSIQAWMDANGADWHRVQFIEVGYSQMEAALASKRVDGTMPVKPFIAGPVGSGEARVVYPVFSAISPRFLESAWFADNDWIAGHRDAIAKFQRVVAQASDYTNAHQSETVPLLATWAGIDPERAAHMDRIVTGSVLDPREIQPLIDKLAKYNVIPHGFDAREIIAR